MADDHGDNGDMEMILFVFGGFALLVLLWFMAGGPAKTDFKGIFLNAPAPINNGKAYGPQITPGTTTKSH